MKRKTQGGKNKKQSKTSRPMSITRKLPGSDETRNRALTVAKTKKDNTPPADVVITANTITRLDAMQPDLSGKMQARGTALQAQSKATEFADKAKAKLRMFISHFFQTFNNAVDREVFLPADRAYYQLDVSSNKLPDLASEEDLRIWGDRIITCDALRVAAGGAQMRMPSIAEFTPVYNDFKLKTADQSTKKDAYDNAQEAVSDMRIEVDKLVLRIWDEVETAFNDEPITSKRRKSREWGVVYVSTKPSEISGTVTIAGSVTPLEGVRILLIETGEEILTDSLGKYVLKTTANGINNLEASKTGYITQQTEIDLTEGQNIVKDFALVAL